MLTQSSQEQSTLMLGQSQGWSSSGGRGRVGAGMVETIDRDVDAVEDDAGCGGKATDPRITARTEEGAIVDCMCPQRAGSPTRKTPSQPPDHEVWGKGGKELCLRGAGKPDTSSIRSRENFLETGWRLPGV